MKAAMNYARHLSLVLAPFLSAPFLSALLLSALLLPVFDVVADQGLAVDVPVDVPVDVQEVTLELIMSHPDWIGTPPERPYWSDDGEAVYYTRKRSGEEIEDLYRIAADSDTSLRVSDEDRGTISVAGGDWNADRSRKVYAHQGDIFLWEVDGDKLTQLTRTTAREQSPHFLVDGRVAWQRGDDFFIRDLVTGLESQPAELRFEKDPEEEAEKDDYLSLQQPRLLEAVREDQEREDLARQRARELHEADATRPPRPWYLGEGMEMRGSVLAPSGDWMAVVVIPKKRDDGKKAQMPSFVSEDGYVEIREVRPKVGTGDAVGEQLWILDLVARETHKVDLSLLPGIEDDPLADLRRQAEEKTRAGEEPESAAEEPEPDADAAAAAAADADAEEAKPRAVRFEAPLRFSPDGSRLAFQAHSYDNKDRWIAVVERSALEDIVQVERLSRPGWINWLFNEYGWLPDSRRLYFLSEASGYSQLYLHDLESGTTHQLTEGEQVVSDPQLSPDGGHLYFAANPEHPGIYEVFRVATAAGGKNHAAGGKSHGVEQLTRLGGRNSYGLSPDGRRLLISHSTTIHPPELYVQEARPGAQARRLTHTVSEAFSSLPWIAPEIVPVPSTHQERPVYSRYYPPSSAAGLGEDRKRPGVVFIHGAGYLQNAHQGWSGYFREFMFHTFLSQQGYAVLDMDYRGSAGYGADWREAIYRQMGTPELEDLEDGVRWLTAEHGVDAERVGTYGGSYGGFLTMMALFKEPDLFACGAALRPVTDWAHYNHPYTSNILNTPDIDPEAYERSSPIEFAEGLSKPLLICAPMVDDNVHFQDTVRLAQKLIELEKENWEVAIYPVEPHGFRRPSSWLDEYRRIFRLFESHLQP